MTRPDAVPSRAWWRRLLRWTLQRAWVHALLLLAVALFLYPLLWMALTSVKTDEELAELSPMPSLPAFRAASPYVREARGPEQPAGVPDAVWARLGPELELEAGSFVLPLLPDVVGVEHGEWARASGMALARTVAARLPEGAWRDEATALEVFQGSLMTDMAREAVRERLARFEIQGITLRTDDARIVRLAGGPSLASTLVVASGEATLLPTDSGTRVAYRFDDGRVPLELTMPVTLPEGVAPDRLHKLMVSIRSDDSWHRLSAELVLGGVRYRAIEHAPLAMHREIAVTFQPPSFDDQTYKARTWQRMERVPADASLGNRLVLRLEPSSTARALYEKAAANYRRAFRSVPFWTYLGNSLALVALTVIGSLFSSAFVGYAFARLRWPGRSIALVVLLATMMLPPQVTMVPTFLVFRELGWYNTLNPLWIGAWLGNAFFIFLMIQHLKTIPKELEEAARIDGLNTLQTWWYIIVPQLKPILAAIAIMSFLGAWNEFLGPLVYLRDQSRFPLSLGLFGMKVDTGSDFSMMMAANLLMTLPAILVFFCFQRYFIQGLTVTGMKG